jgi:hypothetical protein
MRTAHWARFATGGAAHFRSLTLLCGDGGKRNRIIHNRRYIKIDRKTIEAKLDGRVARLIYVLFTSRVYFHAERVHAGHSLMKVKTKNTVTAAALSDWMIKCSAGRGMGDDFEILRISNYIYTIAHTLRGRREKERDAARVLFCGYS